MKHTPWSDLIIKYFNLASYSTAHTVTGTLSVDRGISARKTRSWDRTRLYATAYGQTEEKIGNLADEFWKAHSYKGENTSAIQQQKASAQRGQRKKR